MTGYSPFTQPVKTRCSGSGHSWKEPSSALWKETKALSSLSEPPLTCLQMETAHTTQAAWVQEGCVRDTGTLSPGCGQEHCSSLTLRVPDIP